MANPKPETTYIAYVDYDGNLLSLEFDAFLSEQHQHSAKATQFPVETGAVIADHVLLEPKVVRVEAFVSDTPLPSAMSLGELQPLTDSAMEIPGRTGTFSAFERAAASGEFKGRARGVYLALLEVMEAKKTVTLGTSLQTFENMAIESVDLPVDASRRDALQVSISLRQVLKVGLRTVPVPTMEGALPVKNKGKISTKPAEPKVAEEATWLWSIGDAAKKLAAGTP